MWSIRLLLLIKGVEIHTPYYFFNNFSCFSIILCLNYPQLQSLLSSSALFFSLSLLRLSFFSFILLLKWYGDFAVLVPSLPPHSHCRAAQPPHQHHSRPLSRQTTTSSSYSLPRRPKFRPAPSIPRKRRLTSAVLNFKLIPEPATTTGDDVPSSPLSSRLELAQACPLPSNPAL